MATRAPVRWPGFGRPIGHADLAKHLFQAASLHARRALAEATGDLALLDRATSVGTSVELLAKSALAHINPVLLAQTKESNHLLLFAGIRTIEPESAKTRSASDCMAILNQARSIGYNSARDAAPFGIRNLAAHLGLVDPDSFDDALTIMVTLTERILEVVRDADSSLDRETYWGANLLKQVDERLKEHSQVQLLELEQLKAAAFHEIEQLRRRGLDEAILRELSDRKPPNYIDEDLDFVRRVCPACAFLGWLDYSVDRGRIQREVIDDCEVGPPYVEVDYVPREFYCPVCRLRVSDDLLPLVDMDETEYTTVDALDEEIEAEEAAALEFYYESQRE